jgi:tetratricopeptide (TPR) repeat protein
MSNLKTAPEFSKGLVNASLEDSTSYMSGMIAQYISLGLYSNALFYADKIFYITLNKDLSIISDNLFNLANCLYLNKEFYRCVNIIQKYNMTYYNIKFLNLLGQALYACEDYESVISYLEKDNLQVEKEISKVNNFNPNNLFQSVRHLLIGKAYEMQENKPPAIRNYIKALKYDPGNIEAFEQLITHCLLSSDEKYSIMNELTFDKNNQWLYDYFLSKTHDKIYITEKSDVIINNNIENSTTQTNGNIIDILYNNNDHDLMKIEAEKFFSARDYSNAYIRLKKINEEDFYKLDIIPMYCACMIELNKIGEIYYLAHKLASSCSEKYVSWFAVVRIRFFFN